MTCPPARPWSGSPPGSSAVASRSRGPWSVAARSSNRLTWEWIRDDVASDILDLRDAGRVHVRPLPGGDLGALPRLRSAPVPARAGRVGAADDDRARRGI